MKSPLSFTVDIVIRLIAPVALGLTALVTPVFSQAAPDRPVPPVTEQRVAALQNLRFGMFVCWSFSTFSGKEWTPEVTDINLFKPTGCDTDQWARTAKEAGMGYILFLTKHHDGFCLWDTKTTDRKVTKTAALAGRDVLAELKKSCDKFGIKLALYFSEGEWAWPDKPTGGRYQANGGYNPELKKAQLTELLTQYGPIEYIWFDHAVGDGGLSHADTIKHVKSLQSECFVGFNNGEQEGADIRLGEMGRPGPLADAKAAGPHMRNAPAKSYRLAEFTYPILPPHQGGAMWFYSLPQHDTVCLPAETLYLDYQGAVKYGNVFALDVGPDYRGKLRDIDVQTLRKVGQLVATALKVKAVTASSTWAGQPGFEAAKAIDWDSSTRWGAAENSRYGWLEADLGRDCAVAGVLIDEAGYGRIRKFEIQASQGPGWITVASGTTLAANQVVTFKDPVTTSRIRLTIIEASEVPTVSEFQLFAPAPR